MQNNLFLLPVNEVCKGYVFTRVYHSVHRGRVGIPVCIADGSEHALQVSRTVVSQNALQVCRPTPTGEVEGSGLGVVSRPTPRAEVEGSGLGALQAHTQGVPRPTLGGSPCPHPDRGYPSLHWARPPFPSRQILLWAVCILLECILVSIHAVKNPKILNKKVTSNH